MLTRFELSILNQRDADFTSKWLRRSGCPLVPPNLSFIRVAREQARSSDELRSLKRPGFDRTAGSIRTRSSCAGIWGRPLRSSSGNRVSTNFSGVSDRRLGANPTVFVAFWTPSNSRRTGRTGSAHTAAVMAACRPTASSPSTGFGLADFPTTFFRLGRTCPAEGMYHSGRMAGFCIAPYFGSGTHPSPVYPHSRDASRGYSSRTLRASDSAA